MVREKGECVREREARPLKNILHSSSQISNGFRCAIHGMRCFSAISIICQICRMKEKMFKSVSVDFYARRNIQASFY